MVRSTRHLLVAAPPPLRRDDAGPRGYAISLAADEQDSKGVRAVCAAFDESFSDFVKDSDTLIYQFSVSTVTAMSGVPLTPALSRNGRGGALLF